jgi:hypothetical protein
MSQFLTKIETTGADLIRFYAKIAKWLKIHFKRVLMSQFLTKIETTGANVIKVKQNLLSG